MSILTESCIYFFLWVIYAINPAVKLDIVITSGQAKCKYKCPGQCQHSWTHEVFFFWLLRVGNCFHILLHNFFLSSSLLYPNRNSSGTASRGTAALLMMAPTPFCLSLQHFTSVPLTQSMMHNQHLTSPLPFEALTFIFREDTFCFISCWISLAPWLGAWLLCSFATKSFDLVICAVTGKQGKDFVAAFCNGIGPTLFHFFFF